MRVVDIDFKDLADKVRKDIKRSQSKDVEIIKTDTKKYYDSKIYKDAAEYIKSRYYSAFLQHCIPYLAAIPVVSNKPSECLAKLKSMDYVEVNGEPYSSKQLVNMIVYLTWVPRSSIVVGKMTEGMNPKYGTLTPLLMYALREKYKIPYEYWDKKDTHIKYFLTSVALYEHILVGKIPDITKEEIIRGREIYGDATAWRSTGFNKTVEIRGCKDLARHIIFQTWLASETLREPDSMILDVHNWDVIPDLYDTNSIGTDFVTTDQYELDL